MQNCPHDMNAGQIFYSDSLWTFKYLFTNVTNSSHCWFNINCYLDERCVAEVVSHHDGGVQRGEIQSGNWHVVVAAFGLNDRCAFEVLFASLKKNKMFILDFDFLGNGKVSQLSILSWFMLIFSGEKSNWNQNKILFFRHPQILRSFIEI